jgi:hypothetical protein
MKSRISLRYLKSQAANLLNKSNSALSQGQMTVEEINKLVFLASGLVETTSDFIEDLADGISFELEVKKTGIQLIDDMMKEWGGKIPFVLRIDPREN